MCHALPRHERLTVQPPFRGDIFATAKHLAHGLNGLCCQGTVAKAAAAGVGLPVAETVCNARVHCKEHQVWMVWIARVARSISSPCLIL